MMSLPADFSFSQHNLQDYLECPRRFQLRHIEKMAWPAIQTEPVLEQERHMRLGDRFHQLVQQHQLGFPVEALQTAAASDPDLLSWWQAYLKNQPVEFSIARKVEYTLSSHFAGYRILAKYDLLSIQPGKHIKIIDWKTGRKRIPVARLRERVQTHLYPFLLILAGSHLNGGLPWNPEQVELTYWFTAEPSNPLCIQYSQDQYLADEKLLRTWIEAINKSCDRPMIMTSDVERQCAYCNFRSYCERGQAAGDWEESFEEAGSEIQSISLDFESIEEIEFE